MLIPTDSYMQLEDTLAKMAEAAELDETRRQRLLTSYKTISDLLSSYPELFSAIEIYPQGSVSIGTTTKPYGRTEFDLDIVIHIKEVSSSLNPETVFKRILNRLQEHETYKKIVEPKTRCIRLNYAGDFHLDIVPASMIFLYDDNLIHIPDNKLQVWISSNPKGYKTWFMNCANRVELTYLEKSFSAKRVEIEEYAKKKPLQRIVQLIKMHRNIFFNAEPLNAPASIILTTLAAKFYEGEGSISEAFGEVITRIKYFFETLHPERPFELPNPVNPDENFTEVWEEKPELYRHFKRFINQLDHDWKLLKESHGIEEESRLMKSMFGDEPYIQARKSLSDTIEKQRRNGLSILPIGILTDEKVEGNIPVQKNTFYGD